MLKNQNEDEYDFLVVISSGSPPKRDIQKPEYFKIQIHISLKISKKGEGRQNIVHSGRIKYGISLKMGKWIQGRRIL